MLQHTGTTVTDERHVAANQLAQFVVRSVFHCLRHVFVDKNCGGKKLSRKQKIFLKFWWKIRISTRNRPFREFFVSKLASFLNFFRVFIYENSPSLDAENYNILYCIYVLSRAENPTSTRHENQFQNWAFFLYPTFLLLSQKQCR